jgi:glycosyltransferase involved in cell wall biosynthesis
MQKPRVTLVRGAFLNRYDMQSYAPLTRQFNLRAIGSKISLHQSLPFPVTTLASPMDIPSFPYKMPILNRLLVDAHYLLGLEKQLIGTDIAHTAETYYHYTKQCLDAKRAGMVRHVIATVWETIPHANEGIWGRKQFKKRALGELDHIIAVTKKAKSALVTEGADPKRISVIGAHIDTARFHPATGWERKSGSAKKSFTVLFAGRLVPEKGIGELIETVRRIERMPLLSGYSFRWRFVGDGPLRQDILRLSSEKGKNWHSTLESATYDQMPTIYRSADIFVAPSKASATWEEQYGMALLEAQATGLPIITTRSGGIPENVGDAALTVPPGNAEALASAFVTLVTTPSLRLSLAKKARTRAERVHDIHVGAGQIAAVYRNVLSG